MSETLMPFDMAAMLDSYKAINEYVAQVCAHGDTDELIRAVG
jgi:DNA-binding phage protein